MNYAVGMIHLNNLKLLVGMVFLMMARLVTADTLYTQSRDYQNIFGPSELWQPSGINREVADDFDVVGSVDRVFADGFLSGTSAFQGVYVRFYGYNSDGTPGALQKEYFFTTGFDSSTGAVDVTLAPAFSASGKHFLSVQPIFKNWYWWSSGSGAPRGQSFFYRDNGAGETTWRHNDSQSLTPYNADVAFRLYGTIQGAGTISGLSETSVPRSGYLQIFGSNLSSSGQVLIDGLPAQIAAWANSRIVAYVPEGARLGNVPVQVVNSAGQQSNVVSLTVTERQAQGRLNWRFRQDAPYSTIRPVVAPDGTVHTIDANFHLYSLSPNGALKWLARGAGDSGVAVGPDGSVYVGSQFYVNAYTPAGELKWSFRQDPSALNFVGISVGPDGNIYAVASDGLGAFSLTPQGVLRWRQPEPQRGLLINFCEIVFGPNGKNQQLYYYTNRHLRAFRLDGTPVFTIEDTVSDPTDAQPAVSPDGTVHNTFAAYTPNGNLLWRFNSPFPDNVRTPPDIGSDGTHYFVQNGIQLFGLDPAGNPRWHVTLDRPVQGPIVDPANRQLVAGHAQSGDQPGFVLSSSAQDGHELWRLPLAVEDPTVFNQWTGQFGFNQASDSRPRFSRDGATAYMITFTATGSDETSKSFVNSIDTTLSAPAPTPTPTPAAQMRSVGIDFSNDATQSLNSVSGSVTIARENGAPVADATVTITWTLPNGTSRRQSAATSKKGLASFTTSGKSGVYTLTVADVVKAGMSFDRGNSVLSKSIDTGGR